MAHESEHARLSIERLREYEEVQIPRLYEQLRGSIAAREEQEDELISRTSEEFAALQGLVQQERREREEAEESMLQMLNEIVNRVKEELVSEKHERQDMEEQLVGVLEKTCAKLSASALH